MNPKYDNCIVVCLFVRLLGLKPPKLGSYLFLQMISTSLYCSYQWIMWSVLTRVYDTVVCKLKFSQLLELLKWIHRDVIRSLTNAVAARLRSVLLLLIGSRWWWCLCPTCTPSLPHPSTYTDLLDNWLSEVPHFTHLLAIQNGPARVYC